MPKKTDAKIYYIVLLLLSAATALNLLVNSRESVVFGANAAGYIFSGRFFAFFAVITAVLYGSLFFLFRDYKSGEGPISDKKTMYALAILLAAGFLLALMRNTDRGWAALFNCTAAVSWGVFLFRLDVFNGEWKKQKDLRFAALLYAAAAISLIAAVSGMDFHSSFSTFPKDMGIFANAMWRISEDGSQFTVIEDMQDHRAVHFQPVLYLISPVFRIFCSPYILIILQAFFAVWSCVYIYLLAAKVTGDKNAAFFLALAFLASVYTSRTFVNDYHPESMYIFFFLAFVYHAESRNFTVSVIFACLAAMVKEEAALYTAAAALFFLIRLKDRRYIAVSACLLVYAAAVTMVVMPKFGQGGQGWGRIILDNILSRKEAGFYVDYLVQVAVLFAGVLFLPLKNLKSLVFFIAAPLIIHSLKHNPALPVLFNQWYAAFISPALFAGLIYSIAARNNALKGGGRYAAPAALAVFILQAGIYYSFFSVQYAFSETAAALVFILLVLMAALYLKGKGNAAAVTAALLAVLIFFTGFYKMYLLRKGDIAASGKASVKNAIKHLPKDVNVPVMTNSNIVTHVCCRKYVWAMDEKDTEGVLAPLKKLAPGRFYMLIYFYDFTYDKNGVDPNKRNAEIGAWSEANGYQNMFVYNDGLTGVVEFKKE